MDLRKQVQEIIDNKTKPVGSLGLLETIALKVAMVQQTLEPEIRQPHVVVFAGDHGIAKTGLVNPYPASVTAGMVHNFMAGGAAINVFCRQHQLGLTIVDAGVDADLGRYQGNPSFIDAKIARGTNNYQFEAAMSFEEMERAMGAGASIVKAIAKRGTNTIAFGEMGIGNSSAASLLMSTLMHLPLSRTVGKGTGANSAQLAQKRGILQEVLDKHDAICQLNSPLKSLQYFGGYEIAMMTGAYLGARELNMVIVVDGFIASAALLVAHAIQLAVLDNCLFGHCSGELGHHAILHYLDAQPLLSIGMRLGEGTGAALAMPLIQSAVAFQREMAGMETLVAANQERLEA